MQKWCIGYCKKCMKSRLCVLEIDWDRPRRQNRRFHFSSLTYNGEVTWPTWPHVTLGKIRDKQVVTPLEDTRFCNFHLSVKASLALRALGSCDIWGPYAEVHLWRHGSVTWPELKMPFVSQDPAWIEGQAWQVSALYIFSACSELWSRKKNYEVGHPIGRRGWKQ